MTKPQLRLLAVVLAGLIVIVLFAGLDDLPRNLRAEITTEQQTLARAQQQFGGIRDEVGRDLASDPVLFRVRSMSTAFPQRLDNAGGNLQAAAKDMGALVAFRQADRRRDRDKVEQLLRHERGLRTAALNDALDVQREANHWLDVKRNLPAEVARMEKDYQALRGADLGGITQVVQRAETDWPEKKPDLEGRLAALRAQPAEAEKIWQSTAEARRKVAANDLNGLDYAALIGAAESLHDASAALPVKTGELKNLCGQLYDSWDKILVDLERSGRGRDYREKIRTVRTHLTDVAAKKSDTTTDENWIQVSQAQYSMVENHLGMAIEHKSAGKYDSEAEKVAQPAGFAYIAPPSQGSNQYGHWEHRDGQSFWVWFPQYLILRDLLFNRDYRPLNPGDYDGYRTSQRNGQTYYGRDEAGGPRYGTQGSSTERRYADSNYARSGGYRDSRYSSRSGSYRGSRYQSPAGRSAEPAPESRRSWETPENRNQGHKFGRGGSSRPSAPRSYPRPSGRSFGRRR